MHKPEVIIIAALAAVNRVIAQNGELPWNIPEDSKRFQSLTLNHTVIMGRKTWENDLQQRPLPHRTTIVVTSKPAAIKATPDQVLVCESLPTALEIAPDPEKVFVAGGASIYAQALELADTLELTLVEGDYNGDTFFPEYQHLIGSKFELVAKEVRPGYRFETYRKIA